VFSEAKESRLDQFAGVLGTARAESLRESDNEPTIDQLSAVLGPVRAQLLMVSHTQPTMGELATLTRLAPSAITYHCSRLAAAGLVSRIRRGREVRVSRTERGELLLRLFTCVDGERSRGIPCPHGHAA
jgi:DNA-binding MarR family transcriptional regulator